MSELKPKELAKYGITEGLDGRRGREFWRALEELADTSAFQSHMRSEFPRFAELLEASFDRRSFLKLLAASTALAGAGCSRPPGGKILPYVKSPPELTPGQPVYYASAVPHEGYAIGVLAETNSGRPTKMEGNPSHPASRGATDIFTQAAVLQLWDPDRSRDVLRQTLPSTWSAFSAQLIAQAETLKRNNGDGLHILTSRVTSPTLSHQLEQLLSRYPNAQLHHYQPVMDDNTIGGLQLAYGRTLDVHYLFEKAQTVVALDADFLDTGATRVIYARDFTRLRRSGEHGKEMNRLYCAEAAPSLTGAMADHRQPVRTGRVPALALAIAREVGVENATPDPALSESERKWVTAASQDLMAHCGTGLLLAGEAQPPEVHLLAHAVNEQLGNTGSTVFFTKPVAVQSALVSLASLRELVSTMERKEVDTLLILGGNPVYDAPVDLDFERHLKQIPFSVHCGLYSDETAAASRWHIPQAHPLEQWSDSRSFDGTATVLQPTISPLYGGYSHHQILSLLLETPETDDYTLVRSYWEQRLGGGDFEQRWHGILQRGLIEETAESSVRLTFRYSALNGLNLPAENDETELNFRPDPTVWDGRFSNVGWLQELPKPMTKLTWDNAVLVGPATAKRLNLRNEDVVRLRYRNQTVEGPVLIVPGHVEESVTIHLGYGRRAGGRVSEGAGFNAYLLRHSDAPWVDTGVQIEHTGRRYSLANAQMHNTMEGRDLIRHGTQDEFIHNPNFAHERPPMSEPPLPSLYPDYKYDGYKWGMSVNLNTCTGCAACVVACQAENNIPVVGKEQVQMGREMQWLRIDRYYKGPSDQPEIYFQPVPCMQCEDAPCEPVCPVDASVHDSEGINVQVYNRCIGTRFCSNNCPYKVRRFNFLQYSGDVPALNGQRNPQVTVRMRGVMEKCNYCLQRISNARIKTKIENRKIADGEVVTACQAACPTNAIVFGDLNDKTSRVVQEKNSPLDYALLGELNTKPRTTYRAKLRNPNEKLT